MPATDPRVDAYVTAAAPFARPILVFVRDAVHAGCPGVEETIKWRFPHFMYSGRILASMAAFKLHCAFGFRLGREVADTGKDHEAMGQFGRIVSLADLPGKRELVRIVKRATTLIDAGVKAPRAPKSGTKPPLPVPPDLQAALKRNAAARKTFEGFAPSHRREYIEWIGEAKRADTRARRLAQAIEWLAQRKSRNWKYEAC